MKVPSAKHGLCGSKDVGGRSQRASDIRTVTLVPFETQIIDIAIKCHAGLCEAKLLEHPLRLLVGRPDQSDQFAAIQSAKGIGNDQTGGLGRQTASRGALGKAIADFDGIIFEASQAASPCEEKITVWLFFEDGKESQSEVSLLPQIKVETFVRLDTGHRLAVCCEPNDEWLAVKLKQRIRIRRLKRA